MDQVLNSTGNKVPVDKQRQLRFPTGLGGKEIGEAMMEGNSDVVERSISKIDFSPGIKICDIGCGPGYSLMKLAKKVDSGEIVGVDLSKEMVEMASDNNRKDVDNGLVRVAKSSTPNLDFESNYFDYVMAINVVYFWDEVDPHINEVKRILKTGGKFIIYMVGVENIEKRVGSLGEIFNLYSSDFIKNKLENFGFEIIEDDRFLRRIKEWGNIIVAQKK